MSPERYLDALLFRDHYSETNKAVILVFAHIISNTIKNIRVREKNVTIAQKKPQKFFTPPVHFRLQTDERSFVTKAPVHSLHFIQVALVGH